MPIQPEIALGVQQPNIANTIGSFLDLGNKANALKSSKARATVDTANVQPLIEQQAAQTRSAQAQASVDELNQMRAHVANANQQLEALRADPQLSYDKMEKSIVDTLRSQGAPLSAFAQAAQEMPPKNAPPDVLREYVNKQLLMGQTIANHLEKVAPPPAMVNTGGAIQPVAAGNPSLTGVQPGTPQGTAVPLQVGPQAQEEVQTDAQGNRYIIQRAPNGAILNTRPVPGATNGAPGPANAGPVNLPPNETPQTRDQLQAERTQAQQAILQAPQMHNINQEVARLADSDVTTGKLGDLVNKAASYTGYTLGEQDAADYNTLGKMLARSNATLAASMPGPHTNAGMEQVNAANGSPSYDKVTLKKIANLNDALVTGTELYQKGLENAVRQNGIFGKRQYDQAWSQAMDVDALRLKNAVDNGNQGEIQMLIKTVGGKGSPGAKKLFDKLQRIDALAGQ